jgi:hypothetical protein
MQTQHMRWFSQKLFSFRSRQSIMNVDENKYQDSESWKVVLRT